MYFIYFIAICLIATIVIAVITCQVRIKTHQHKTKGYKEIINKNLYSEELKDFFLVLCDRSFDYIQIYFIFQGVAKAVNGLSLLFTVSSLVLSVSDSLNTNIPMKETWEIIVAIISIIFVCIIIYINPTKRASQYLECWRNTDKNIVKLIASISNNTDAADNSNHLELKNFALECAEDLSNGEFKITSDEE